MKKIKYTEYTCNMCGEIFYTPYNTEGSINEAIPCSSKKGNFDYLEEYIFEFEIPVPGYGSFLDGVTLEKVHICDNCLHSMYEDLKIKPEVLYY